MGQPPRVPEHLVGSARRRDAIADSSSPMTAGENVRQPPFAEARLGVCGGRV